MTSAGEKPLSGGPVSTDYGIGLVGQLKVALRETEPAELETVTVTVGREPREQRPKYEVPPEPFGQTTVAVVDEV